MDSLLVNGVFCLLGGMIGWLVGCVCGEAAEAKRTADRFREKKE